MSRSPCGVLLAYALTSAMALGALAPVEHLHEGDDHHRPVAHRHIAAHDHDGARLSDADGAVIWLDDVFVQGTMFRLDIPMPATIVSAGFQHLANTWVRTLSYDSAPTHGPPRSGLVPRAPPALPSSAI